MNGNTVHEGNTIHDRVGCPGTAAPLQSYCAMLYSGNKLAVGLMTRKQ